MLAVCERSNSYFQDPTPAAHFHKHGGALCARTLTCNRKCRPRFPGCLRPPPHARPGLQVLVIVRPCPRAQCADDVQLRLLPCVRDVPVFLAYSLRRRVVIIDLCAQEQTLLESFYGQGTGAIMHNWKRTYNTLGIIYQKERTIKPRHRALLRIAGATLRCGFAEPARSPRSTLCGPAQDHSPWHENAPAGAVLPCTVNACGCVDGRHSGRAPGLCARPQGRRPQGALAAVAVICARA